MEGWRQRRVAVRWAPQPLTLLTQSPAASVQGAWRPSLSIATVLASIQLLMAEPNPDDPLMADIVSAPELCASEAVGEAAQPWNSPRQVLFPSPDSLLWVCLSPQSLNTTSPSSSRMPGSGQRSTRDRDRW